MAPQAQAITALEAIVGLQVTDELQVTGNLQAYKTRLEPNPVQLQVLKQHAGTARWAYNWGLGIRQEAYKYGVKENAISLHKLLNSLKKEHYSWLYEVSKCAPQEALRDLDNAYEHFFRRCKEGKQGKALGYPKFKTRGKSEEKFRLTGAIRVAQEADEETGTVRAYMQLPRIGQVRLSEADYLLTGDYSSASIKEKAGCWYVSVKSGVAVKEKHLHKSRNSAPVGIDAGLSSRTTLSDGHQSPALKHLHNNLRQLRKLEKEKSRRKLGSANRAKTVFKLQRLHATIANQRADTLHKLTTELATTNTNLVIEDLNTAGMIKNYKLALSLHDAAFGEFRRQLEYKCKWYNCGLTLAPRFYPSTQKCSDCGHVKEGDNKLSLNDRSYECEECGLVLNRDVNAARNLAALHGSKEARVLNEVIGIFTKSSIKK